MKKIIKKIVKKVLNKPALPENYHADYDEGSNKYTWYYIGRNEGKKDYSPHKYFNKYQDAVNDAIEDYKLKKSLKK